FQMETAATAFDAILDGLAPGVSHRPQQTMPVEERHVGNSVWVRLNRKTTTRRRGARSLRPPDKCATGRGNAPPTQARRLPLVRVGLRPGRRGFPSRAVGKVHGPCPQ